jgi:hypothetical protein
LRGLFSWLPDRLLIRAEELNQRIRGSIVHQGALAFQLRQNLASQNLIEMNAEANMANEVEVSTADSKVKVYVIPTDEELVIAQDTAELIG